MRTQVDRQSLSDHTVRVKQTETVTREELDAMSNDELGAWYVTAYQQAEAASAEAAARPKKTLGKLPATGRISAILSR
jgi:hypothetical protein